MQRHHTQLLLKITAWLVTEILLNFVGLDAIANYGEFLSLRTHKSVTSYHVPAPPVTSEQLPVSRY